MTHQHLLSLAVCAALATTTPLAAHHERPVFNSSVTTLELVNKPGTPDEDVITITWTAKPVCYSADLAKKLPDPYEIVIKRTRKTEIVLSLFTLGLQGVNRKNEIKRILLKHNTAVEFQKNDTAAFAKPVLELDGSTSVEIEAAAVKTHDDGQKRFVDESTIGFVKLTGTEFKFELVSYPGMRIMKHDWNLVCSVRDAHDNEPPKNPPD